jgi:hypothetical protein
MHPESKNQSCIAATKAMHTHPIKASHLLYVKRNMCCIVCHTFLTPICCNSWRWTWNSCYLWRQLVIRFLNYKNVCLVEIHWQIVETYGEGAMNKGNMTKWCWLFKEGRTIVWNEVGAHLWSRIIWKKKWMHKLGKTLHQVISTCFST